MARDDVKRVLLFGGGDVHDFLAICSVLQAYLEEIEALSVDFVVEDYDVFVKERIQTYDLALVYHTGGALSAEQATGLTQWVAAGNGFVGVHSATDSFTSNPDYIAMVGAVFRRHPAVRRFIVSLVDPVPGVDSIENELAHPITAGIEGITKKDWEAWPIFEYEVEDEQYLMEMVSHVEVLASALYKGRACPIAWTHVWGEGRVFYLALGHDVHACGFPFFKTIFQRGARWAAGLL